MYGLNSQNSKLQSETENFKSRPPENFQEAMDEFSSYCKQQLPTELLLAFSPTCFDITADEQYAVVSGQYGNICNIELASQRVLRDEEISSEVSIRNVLLILGDTQVIASNDLLEIFFLEYPSFEILFKYQLYQGPLTIKRTNSHILISSLENHLTTIKTSKNNDFYSQNFELNKIKQNERIFTFDINNESELAALALESGVIQLLSLTSIKDLQATESHPVPANLVAFSPNNALVSASFQDFSIKLWKLENNLTLIYTSQKHSDLVSGLAFVKSSKYLASACLDSVITLWDTVIESSPYTMTTNDCRILSMKAGNSGNTLFYIQDSNNFLFWTVPQISQTAKYKTKSRIVKVLFIPGGYELISVSETGETVLWDCKTHSMKHSCNLEFCVSDAKLIPNLDSVLMSSHGQRFLLWNFTCSSVDRIEVSFEIVAFQVSDNYDVVAISDQFSRVVIHDFPSMEKRVFLKGHLQPVTGCIFTDNDQTLFTCSKDCTVGKWEIESSTRVAEMKGHQSEIVSLLLSPHGYILSGSSDGAVLIWTKDCFLLYTLTAPNPDPILRIYLSYYNDYLITLQQFTVNYWQMENLTLIFQTRTSLPASSFSLSQDEKVFARTEDDSIYVEENAFEAACLRITGAKGSPHRFMQFVLDCQNTNSTALYDMQFNNWTVVPYLFGPAHILAYCNRFSELQKCLFTHLGKASFFASVKNETPLTICVEMEFKNCIDVCLKYIKSDGQDKKEKKRNPRAYIPLESCLAKLNRIDYPFISKLYEGLFVENHDAYLPRFCKFEVNLPNHFMSERFTIFPATLADNDLYANSARPVVFSNSLISLHLDPGSNASIEFLESLLACSDVTIFRSKLIQELLQYKWSKLKAPTYAICFIYILYLTMLAFHMVLLLTSKTFLFLLILVHIVLVAFEVLQIATDFGDYWRSTWNVLDQLRSISFSFYALMAWGGDYNTDILLSVLIFSWTRGIACFRMFDETRYMVRLIIQVIVDITAFFFLLFYATMAFAFVFYLRNPTQPFAMYLTVAYRLDLGDLDTNLTEMFDWGIFFVATLINPLIMLNLLIAIMSDTASYVDTIDDICGLRELTQMVMDMEKVMFWKKHLKHKHFLHKLDYVGVSDEEVDKKVMKIAIIKKQVVKGMKTAKKLQKVVKKIKENKLGELLEEFEEHQEGVKSVMNSGFDRYKELIMTLKENLKPDKKPNTY